MECHHALTRKDLGFSVRVLTLKVELLGLFVRSYLRQGDAAIGVRGRPGGAPPVSVQSWGSERKLTHRHRQHKHKH
jgi:hypothetical protein